MPYIEDPGYYWVDIHPGWESNNLYMCGMCRRISTPKRGLGILPILRKAEDRSNQYRPDSRPVYQKGAAMIEYSIGFNCVGELVIIEFNRTNGTRRYIHLVVKDGKIVMDCGGRV